VFSTVFVQSDVDLARAENHAVYFFWCLNVVGFVSRVGDDPLEVRFASEVFDGRAGERMA